VTCFETLTRHWLRETKETSIRIRGVPSEVRTSPLGSIYSILHATILRCRLLAFRAVGVPRMPSEMHVEALFPCGMQSEGVEGERVGSPEMFVVRTPPPSEMEC
jgi:hypothetical protein